MMLYLGDDDWKVYSKFTFRVEDDGVYMKCSDCGDTSPWLEEYTLKDAAYFAYRHNDSYMHDWLETE